MLIAFKANNSIELLAEYIRLVYSVNNLIYKKCNMINKTEKELIKSIMLNLDDDIENEDEVSSEYTKTITKTITKIIDLWWKIIWGFTNTYWEEYIIYKFKTIPNIFVTWSELDYELMYEYTNNWELVNRFILDDSEKWKIKMFLNEYNKTNKW